MPWKRVAILFVAAFAVYALFAWERLPKPSPQFHFADLAWSLMHGRLDTDAPEQLASARKADDPPGYRDAIQRTVSGGGWNDWSSYHVVTLKGGEVVRGVWPWGDGTGGKEKRFRTLDGTEMVVDKELDIATGCKGRPLGRCDEKLNYVSFPPFPSVLMMPAVALFGYSVNDVLFTVFFAALNVALMFLLLQHFTRQGLTDRAPRENLILALVFAFGTSHFFSSVRGEVWFTGLVVGVTVNALFILAATRAAHPVLAGLLLACGFLTRTPLLFGGGVYFALQLLLHQGRWLGLGVRETIKRGLLFALPFVPLFGLALAYNYVRFGSPMEFGHSYIQDGMRPSIREHGLMSFWFLNANLSAALTNLPVLTTDAPYLKLTRHGLGLLCSTPVFLLLLRLRRWDYWTWVMLAAVAATSVPILLYQNTGWAQFSYRFSLDFTPYLFLLLALDRRPLGRSFWVLAIIAVVVQAFGAATFGRVNSLYYD
jgi:hypothetical protein